MNTAVALPTYFYLTSGSVSVTGVAALAVATHLMAMSSQTVN